MSSGFALFAVEVGETSTSYNGYSTELYACEQPTSLKKKRYLVFSKYFLQVFLQKKKEKKIKNSRTKS